MEKKEKLLEVRNLYKDFGNGPVLKNVSFKVHKGEVIVIIGPSGCGKSTLLRCINGLEEIQKGEILLNREVITGKNTNWREVRQKIGMVFQSYDLFPHKKVIDNIMLGPLKVQKRNIKEVKQEAMQMLKRVGLAEKKDVYPRQLSGGQKQRVAIIRMLMMHPEIMLFDEPTSALDPEMIGEVLDLIKKVADTGKTMVIVSHEMNFVKKVSNRVLFIDGGKVIFDGKTKDFFSSENIRIKEFLDKIKK